jgi:SNF2 family DNA or RNA helicase
MALRQDPVRLLIADDVGVGKTIEAAMVARELLDRGVIRRIGVLCPPHLCDQWAEELRDKFNIEAAVVQPSRMARLERGVPRPDIHVFEHYRHLVASIDFVKSDRHRRSFVDNAPDLIIVDEAHTATRPRSDTTGSQQQRFRLLKDLVDDQQRHLVLTTATPHSGIEESFRSLIGLLDNKLDTPIERNIPQTSLAPYLVQRRRADLQNWLGAETPFPERDSVEQAFATGSPRAQAQAAMATSHMSWHTLELRMSSPLRPRTQTAPVTQEWSGLLRTGLLP